MLGTLDSKFVVVSQRMVAIGILTCLGEVCTTHGAPGSPDDDFIYDPVAKFWRVSGLIQDATDLALWNNQPGVFDSPDIQGMSEPLVPGGCPLTVGNKPMPGSLFPDGVGRQVSFILKPIGSAMSSALKAAAVPEPTAILLLAVGLMTLPARRRR
jgi:hypothetical protein